MTTLQNPMISFRVGVLSNKILQFQIVNVHMNVHTYLMIYGKLENYHSQSVPHYEDIRFLLALDDDNLLSHHFCHFSTERDFSEYGPTATVFIPLLFPTKIYQLRLDYNNTTRQNAVVARIISAIMQFSADVKAWDGRRPQLSRKTCKQPLYEF